MPAPKKNEKKSDYIGRCMGTPKMNDEFPDTKQRAAVCYSYWDKSLNETMTFKDFLKEDWEEEYKNIVLNSSESISRRVLALAALTGNDTTDKSDVQAFVQKHDRRQVG